MITVQFPDEQAQLIANLLNNHKQSNQKIADLSSEALDTLLDASKKEAQTDAKQKSDQ